MRVVVTGGTGFLGRHLVRALLARGEEVIVVGRRATTGLSDWGSLASVVYEALDLADRGAAGHLIERWRPDRVFHLAGPVDVSRRLELLDHQIVATQLAAVELARACLDLGVGRLVHVGTCEEYGNGPAPFREDQHPAPVSPYSAAKAAATGFVTMLCASFGLRAVVVRPFLTYGPGQSLTPFVPAIITSALAGRDFPMTGGEQTRDFNYVDDIVEGLVRAGNASDVDGQIINLGCGEPQRIRDVASLIVELMGRPIKVEFGKIPYRPGETWEFYSANDKAKRLLGWAPKVSLEDGLGRTIAWYRTQQHGAAS